MSTHEVAAGLNFLVSTLKANATVMSLALGGIKRGAAPVGTLFPCIIIAFHSGLDVTTFNARRLMVNALYQVKSSGVSDGTQAVFDLAAAIDDALGGNQGLRNVAVPGGYALSCYRESPLSYDDETAGIQYAHMGGLYRLQLQQVP